MIVIIAGSPRGEKSVSTTSARRIAELSGFPYRLYDASAWHLDYCNACNQCARDGRCTLDSGDDFDAMLRDFRSADGLILASPVYCGSYSAQLKTFLDRIAPDLHTMTLLGKPAVVLTASESSFGERTAEGLSELMEFAGAEITDRVVIDGNTRPARREELLQKAADKLCRALDADHIPFLSERTLDWYKTQAVKYRLLLKLEDCFPEVMGEAKLWRSLGYCECRDAAEAAVMRRSRAVSSSSSI